MIRNVRYIMNTKNIVVTPLHTILAMGLDILPLILGIPYPPLLAQKQSYSKMATIDGSKRPRIDGDSPRINDLPIGFLVEASNLCKPSRAIFAVSLSSKMSWKKVDGEKLPTISKAIIIDQWDTLDFVDIEKSLAYKLKDDDLHAVLTSINAKQTLKTLKLTNCINIIGHGLDPLRQTNVLKLLDLSLVGKYDNPSKVHYDEEGHAIRDQQRNLMSPEVVLPVIDSIIASDRCALRYIVFPYMWHWRRVECAALFDGFAGRYNERFERSRLSCANCSTSNILSTSLGNVHPWMDRLSQYNVCYDCLKSICRGCAAGEWDDKLKFCERCQKYFCSDCVKVGECEHCSETVCRGCNKTCDQCESIFCDNICLPTCDSCGRGSCRDCDNVLQCSSCGDDANCRGCYNGEEYTVDECRCCQEVYCSDCVPSDTGCWACMKVVKIREQAKEIQKQAHEIEELKKKLGK